MRDQQTSMNISLSQCHLCLFPFHCLPPFFCVLKTWKFYSQSDHGEQEKKSWACWWRSAEGCCGYLHSSRSPHPFSGSLSIWPNILRFNAELSWERSAKSVSISRPQSSSVWVGHLMIVQEVYFRARPGDGGSRWTELWTAHWHTELSEHQLRAVLP